MLAALACASSQGLWILTDAAATRVIAAIAWNDTDSSDIAIEIGPRFEQLLRAGDLAPDQLHGISVVTGPGAFTGLRVSASFALGLARALRIPVRPIPTFDLLGHVFQIPLQHQRQKHLPLAQAAQAQAEVLRVEGPATARIQPAEVGIPALGFAEVPLWPTPEQLRRAAALHRVSTAKVDVFYGLNPKISGVRA